MSYPKSKTVGFLTTVIAVSMGMTSCQDNMSDFGINSAEEYQRAFIEKFGIPAEGHTYNMARASKVTVKASSPTDVKVVAVVADTPYLFADYKDVTGVQDVEFDIPLGVDEVTVITKEGETYRVPVGSTVDLDKSPLEYHVYSDKDIPAKSRADESEYTFLSYVPSINMNGNLIPINQDVITVSEIYWTYLRATGWELSHYLDKDYMSSVGLEGDNFDTWDELANSVMYWNKHTADAVYEIGVVYRENDSEGNEHKICVPFYRTDAISGKKSSISRFGLIRNEDYLGCAITIDFENKTQKVVPAKWAENKSFSSFFLTLYNDKQMLADIEDLYAHQSLLPKASDWYGGSPEYGLPPYDETNTLPFWEKWDEFVYDWTQDNLIEEERSHLHELVPLKEYFGFFYMCFPSEHAYPMITKEEGSNQKYTVTYFTPRYFSYDRATVPDVTDTEMYEIVNHGVYNSELQIAVDQVIKYNKRYGFYVRDCSTGKTYDTLSGNHTTAHYRFLCGSNHSVGRQYVIQMDLNDDGVFDDFMLFAVNRPVDSDDIDFKPFTWIIAAEDLGSTDDWDFNDLVCLISYVSTNSTSSQEITVRPMAAGGIYPIYLMYTDPLEAIGTHVIGTEMHKWLRADLGTYNTNKVFDNRAYGAPILKFTYDVAMHNGQRFSLDKYDKTLWEGTNMGGLWVLVDKENRYGGIIDDAIEFRKFDRVFDDAKNWPELNLINTPIRDDYESGNTVPMIMCVGKDWEWPAERMLISDCYPKWLEWLTNPNTQWYDKNSGKDKSKVTHRVDDNNTGDKTGSDTGGN